MTDRQIQLVKQTWRLLREVDPHLLGDVFYRRLFMEFPGVRLLFRGPMDAQYEKFVAMLSFIVARIDRPDALRDEVVEMAKRHEGYGVKPFHYPLVAEALLWTLEKGLGKAWNEDVQQAWTVCYDALSQIMLAKA